MERESPTLIDSVIQNGKHEGIHKKVSIVIRKSYSDLYSLFKTQQNEDNQCVFSRRKSVVFVRR